MIFYIHELLTGLKQKEGKDASLSRRVGLIMGCFMSRFDLFYTFKILNKDFKALNFEKCYC